MGCAASSDLANGNPVNEAAPRSVFPADGGAPTDNRPMLKQQPRRKSLDGSTPGAVPPVTVAQERRRSVGMELSPSQQEFFKMLEQKVESKENASPANEMDMSFADASIHDIANFASIDKAPLVLPSTEQTAEEDATPEA